MEVCIHRFTVHELMSPPCHSVHLFTKPQWTEDLHQELPKHPVLDAEILILSLKFISCSTVVLPKPMRGWWAIKFSIHMSGLDDLAAWRYHGKTFLSLVNREKIAEYYLSCSLVWCARWECDEWYHHEWLVVSNVNNICHQYWFNPKDFD